MKTEVRSLISSSLNIDSSASHNTTSPFRISTCGARARWWCQEKGLVRAVRFSQHYYSVVARLEPHQGSVVWAEVWFVVPVSENLQHVRSLTHLAEQ
jgi:hypothetical protein